MTFNHRVVILRGGARQTIPASHLRVGDSILTASGEKSLVGVNHFFGDTDIYEMALEPDAPVETFFIESDATGALLTKGK